METNNYFYCTIALIMLYKTIKPRKSNAGMFSPDTSGLCNILWGIVLLMFTLIWGGIFWW